MSRWLGAPWFVWLCLSANLSIADQARETRAKLEQVQTEISGLQSKMQHTRGRYELLQEELQQTETSIGQLAQQLLRLERDLASKQRRLRQLQQRREGHSQQLQRQREELARQIRAAYMMGREDYLKLLLNQQDPSKLSRLLSYYDYFNRARATKIQAINETLERLQIVSAEIEQQTDLLKGLAANKQARRADLEQEYQSRQRILARLEQTLSGQTEALRRLQTDKQELEGLLKRLRETVAELPPAAQGSTNFRRLRGHLPHPVKGQLAHRYGDKREFGGLKWQGRVYHAQRGDPVRAVAPGRVVFADWFRNLGQLLILDHGQGYMSLYAHARSLEAATGDDIKAGQRIATVGESGGRDHPSLYFEIRHQGAPINPAPWFNK